MNPLNREEAGDFSCSQVCNNINMHPINFTMLGQPCGQQRVMTKQDGGI